MTERPRATSSAPETSSKWDERKELVRQAWRRLRGGELTPLRAGLSVGVGLAIGMTPAFGFHWLLVIGICVPLRLDTGVAYLAANISMPLIAPFLTFAELEVGAWLVRGSLLPIEPSDVRDLNAAAIRTLALELAVGTAVLAPTTGALGGALAYGIVAWRRRRAQRHREARARARARARADHAPPPPPPRSETAI